MPDLIPPVFDPVFYKGLYGDVSHLSDDEAFNHYVRFGIPEGRQGASAGCRPAFTQLVKGEGLSLEIGPFCQPILRGGNVRYLDVWDSDKLRDLALLHGQDPIQCPEQIHYVGTLDLVDEKFDRIVSSHAVEHQPDLIEHLNGVSKLLNPGGHYFLFVPDKRYCFDHFLPETTLADVITAHHEQRTRHSLSSILNHYTLATHNDAVQHWEGNHGPRPRPDRRERLEEALKTFDESDGGYVDTHSWYLTPMSVIEIFTELKTMGLIDLSVPAVYPTIRDSLEFFVVLRKDEVEPV